MTRILLDKKEVFISVSLWSVHNGCHREQVDMKVFLKLPGDPDANTTFMEYEIFFLGCLNSWKSVFYYFQNYDDAKVSN